MLENIANIFTWVMAVIACTTCAFIAVEALRWIVRRIC